MKSKKSKKRSRLRNAAPVARVREVPRAPRGPRASNDHALRRLGFTAAGAAGTALVGSFLSREGWAPKTIATALAAVGAGLAWKGDEDSIRSLGAGAMSAAGSQLALMLLDDRNKPAASASPPATTPAVAKPANAGELPPGALESAFERAKARLAMSSSAAMSPDPQDEPY